MLFNKKQRTTERVLIDKRHNKAFIVQTKYINGKKKTSRERIA